MDNLEISRALEAIFDFLRSCNKYIDDTAPWLLAKEEDKHPRLATVLYNLFESIRIAAVLLQAYIPDTADSIFKQINTDIRTYDSISEFGKYQSGTKVNSPEVLFARIEKNK
jgi:methionyl-tRNA synthetase